MAKFTKYWQDSSDSVPSTELVGDSDFDLPDWLTGEFILSGPSQWNMGKNTFAHVLDGFGRFSRFKIEDGKIAMTSKMMDTKWYETCEAQKEIIPGMTFRETTPPRWMANVPGVNLYYSSHYFDNFWVMPFRMPDKQTYVGLTDMADMLEMDIDTLQSKGKLKWEDDLKCQTGTTHVQELDSNTMVGVCGEISSMG